MTDQEPHPIDSEVTAAMAAAAASVPDLTHDTLDAARIARDRHARRRHRRIRTVTLGAAAAVLLAVAGTALALNSQDPAPQRLASNDGETATTSPSSAGLPIPLDQARESCPDRPVDRDLGTAADGGSGPLLEFSPTEVIVCNYQGNEQLGGSVLIPADVERVIRDLAALDPVPDHLECTAEAGPTVGLIVTDGSRTETVWLQFYGCGLAFSGDNNRVGAKSLSWLADDGSAASEPNGAAEPTPSSSQSGRADESASSPTQPSTSGAASTPQSQPATAGCPARAEPLPATAIIAEQPLLDFTPTSVIVCSYPLTLDLADQRAADAATMNRIVRGLREIDPGPPTRECTQELGTAYALIVIDRAGRTQTIWLQIYGCGVIHTGDRSYFGARSFAWLLP